MAYSILLSVKKPDETKNWKVSHQLNAEYNDLVKTLKELPQNEDIQLLSEGTVLLQLDHGLQGLLGVLNSLGTLSYTYIILPEDTKWYEATNKV